MYDTLFPLLPPLLLGAGLLTWEGIRGRRKALSLLRSGIDGTDRMSGGEFETFLAALFEREGFAVRRVGRTGDFGADLVLGRGSFRAVVQAKRYRGRVGVRAVQEAAAAKGYYRCRDAWIVTNSRFTAAAIELARANGVLLIDRDRLARLILRTRSPERPP